MITIEQARPLYTLRDSSHDFDHVLRVYHLVERIGAAEGADLDILRSAALLHDIGRPEELETGESHAVISARMAREILMGNDPEYVDAVAKVIEQHRYRANTQPSSLEAMVLFDADKLDSIGAFGVARAYAWAGVHQQKLWAPVDEDYANRPRKAGLGDHENGVHTPVHEFHFKLVKLKDKFYTQTGRELAEHRHAFMVSFFNELEAEQQGKA